MSHENVEIVRQAVNAFNRGDVEAAVAPFAPDIEWDVSQDIWGDVVGGGHYRGVDGVRAWLRELTEAWGTIDLRYDEDVIEVGDQVVTVLSARGRGRYSKIAIEHHPAGVVTVVEGKMARVTWFASREAALASARTSQNVAVVRGLWEAFARNDIEGSLSAFHPDVEWDGTNLPDGNVSHGLDGVVAHVTNWAEMWETWEVELEDVIDAGGDQVIAFIRERGRTKAGVEINERHSELYAVRNGKIAYRKGFSDADEALDVAGLR